jgi:hypothetical protein
MPDHNGGVHRRKIELRDVFEGPHRRLEYQPPLIHLEQDLSRLPALGLPFAPGDEEPPLHSQVELHRGENGADRGASGTLYGKLGQTCQFDNTTQAGFVIEEGVCAIDVPAPV